MYHSCVHALYLPATLHLSGAKSEGTSELKSPDSCCSSGDVEHQLPSNCARTTQLHISIPSHDLASLASGCLLSALRLWLLMNCRSVSVVPCRARSTASIQAHHLHADHPGAELSMGTTPHGHWLVNLRCLKTRRPTSGINRGGHLIHTILGADTLNGHVGEAILDSGHVGGHVPG